MLCRHLELLDRGRKGPQPAAGKPDHRGKNTGHHPERLWKFEDAFVVTAERFDVERNDSATSLQIGSHIAASVCKSFLVVLGGQHPADNLAPVTHSEAVEGVAPVAFERVD